MHGLLPLPARGERGGGRGGFDSLGLDETPPHPPRIWRCEATSLRARGEVRMRTSRGIWQTDRHAAAFDACASDANVLPSAARRFSSGAGSRLGSLVSLA